MSSATPTAHDFATCPDLDCAECFPEYIPAVGDFVEDSLKNVWCVTAIGTERGRFIELRHAVHRHYADAPMTEGGGFRYSAYRKVELADLRRQGCPV